MARDAATEKRMLAHARSLRAHQTDAENRLWFHLRAHRLMGLKFKRQEPMGPYVVDFVCHPCRLIIEADGSQHAVPSAYELAREQWLEEHGYVILRFWDNEILMHTDAVLERILSVATERDGKTLPSPPAPPPGEGR